MNEKIQYPVEELGKIFESIRQIQRIATKYFKKYRENLTYDISQINKESRRIREIFKILKGKYTIELMHTLHILKNPYFNDLKNAHPEMSSRILTDRLRRLAAVSSRGLSPRMADRRPGGLRGDAADRRGTRSERFLRDVLQSSYHRGQVVHRRKGGAPFAVSASRPNLRGRLHDHGFPYPDLRHGRAVTNTPSLREVPVSRRPARRRIGHRLLDAGDL